MHQDKLERLQTILCGYGRVSVAFSGGVDSTFLMKVAHDTLGDNAVALTLRSVLTADEELAEAQAWCTSEGIPQVMVEADVLSIPGFAENPPDRCYVCKTALFTQLLQAAENSNPGSVLVDGSNVDDLSDYRPGAKALAELNIQSPLQAAGFTKVAIRDCSHQLGLPTWHKPSAACLASRFPYGDVITKEGLAKVAAAERIVHQAGFDQARVRIHGGIARIEVLPVQLAEFVAAAQQNQLTDALHELGFSFVTLDLDGYRMGSLNELLKEKELANQDA